MTTYKGMNFGPILGSAIAHKEPMTSGRLIRIRKYNGAGTNPLQGGYWSTEFIDTGGPDGYIGSIPIDYPPSGGGSGPGGGGGKGDKDPDLECPHWTKVFGPNGDFDTCTDEQKKRLKASYERIAYSKPWVRELEPIGYGNDWLLGCIRSKMCGIEINCTSEGVPPRSVYQENNSPRPRLTVATSIFDKVNPWEFDHSLLLSMILACGGTWLDASVISEITPREELAENGGKYFRWKNIDGKKTNPTLIDLLDNSDFDYEIIDGRQIVVGKWVWWDRKRGNVGLIPSLDLILNYDHDRPVSHWRF